MNDFALGLIILLSGIITAMVSFGNVPFWIVVFFSGLTSTTYGASLIVKESIKWEKKRKKKGKKS